MPDLHVNNVIIHELVKEQHQNIKENKYGAGVLDSSNEIVRRLVESIVIIYGSKYNAAQYGIFADGSGRGTFPDKFLSYFRIETPSESDFIKITKDAMLALYGKAQGRTAASGGYILFADYISNGGRFFVIVMIKQKSGITLSDDLKPQELIELDLNKIHQAARVSFAKIQGYLSTQDPRARDEQNYLSFISPRSNKATAGYFITALGCAEGAASAQATKNLIAESRKFFINKPELRQHAGDFTERLTIYLDERQKNGISVKLSQVEAIAREYFPAEDLQQADHLADEFFSNLHNEPLSVPIEFSVNKSTLQRFTYIKAKANNWDLNFSKSALGDEEGAEIFYDEEENKLVINQLPEKVITQIEDTLRERREEEY